MKVSSCVCTYVMYESLSLDLFLPHVIIMLYSPVHVLHHTVYMLYYTISSLSIMLYYSYRDHLCCHYTAVVDDDDDDKVKEEVTAMLEDRVKC